MRGSRKIGYSNILDLDQFFFMVQDQAYVIVKLVDFPNYYSGGDIDIFCYDIDLFAKQLLGVGNRYIDQGFEIEVLRRDEGQTYIDFYLDGELEFRFDLYQKLPRYKNINVKEQLIYSLIENGVPKPRSSEGNKYFLFVPSITDDLILRYIEYIEWYRRRPDKIKHLEYIKKMVTDNPSRIGFLDKLHIYTDLPKLERRRTILNGFYPFRWATFWYKRFRSLSWRRILNYLRRRFSFKH